MVIDTSKLDAASAYKLLVDRFHIRDDLLLQRGRIDTAAISAVGRLAAEYNLVNNVFTTPLDAEFLRSLEGLRMARLDEQDRTSLRSTPVPGPPRARSCPDRRKYLGQEWPHGHCVSVAP